MNMKKILILVGAFITVGITITMIGIAQNQSDSGDYSDSSYVNFISNLWKLMENRDLTISGTVVDEADQVMRGVDLEITRITSTGFGSGNRNVEKRKVQGSFEVEGRGVSVVQLRFIKDGYYPAEVSIASDTDKPTQGLRVTLEKVAEVVPMIRYEDRIVFNFSGGGGVFDFTIPFDPEWGAASDFIMTVDSLYAHARLPEHGLYLEADVENDKIAAVIKDVNGFGLMKPVPRAVRLVMINENDGFILTGIDTTKPSSDVLRGMKEAPRDGYVRTITVPPRANNYYFYFRVDERYGKGLYVSTTDYRDHEIENVLELRLQPVATGSRNVTTEY